MIKTLQKEGIEGTYLNIIKAIYDKPTASIIVIGEKLKVFSLKSGTRQGCPLSPLQHSFRCFNNRNQRRKRNKRIQIGREVKLSLFADDMILYIENRKDSTRKSLELIMNTVKLQDIKLTHRNPLHSYILTMRTHKVILRKQ